MWLKLVGCAHQLEPHYLPLKIGAGWGLTGELGSPVSGWGAMAEEMSLAEQALGERCNKSDFDEQPGKGLERGQDGQRIVECDPPQRSLGHETRPC